MAEAAKDTERAFFEQVAQGYDAALGAAESALRSQPGADEYFEAADELAELRQRLVGVEGVRAFHAVLGESLQAMAHSFFAVLDGSTADRPEERVVAADLEGRRLEQGLHERWVDFLLETGRLE